MVSRYTQPDIKGGLGRRAGSCRFESCPSHSGLVDIVVMCDGSYSKAGYVGMAPSPAMWCCYMGFINLCSIMCRCPFYTMVVELVDTPCSGADKDIAQYLSFAGSSPAHRTMA